MEKIGFILFYINKHGHRMYYTVNKQWVNEGIIKVENIRIYKTFTIAKKAANKYSRFFGPIHIVHSPDMYMYHQIFGRRVGDQIFGRKLSSNKY